MMKIKRQNKLRTYLAVTAGVGCAASVAEGAVTFYGVNSANDTNDDPLGIGFGVRFIYYTVSLPEVASFGFLSGVGSFTRGSDLVATSGTLFAFYGNATSSGGFNFGAVAGDQNFANVSFNGDDDVYEAVAQFNFDGMGGGFLVALAFAEGTTLSDGITPLTNANAPSDLSTLTNTSALSISEGVALIEAAAVPEPSSLVLLALGATGLAARRKRKMAA